MIRETEIKRETSQKSSRYLRTQLKELGLSEGDLCVCGERETPEHILRNCTLYDSERALMVRKVGMINIMTDAFYDELMLNEKIYEAFKQFAMQVISKRNIR